MDLIFKEVKAEGTVGFASEPQGERASFNGVRLQAWSESELLAEDDVLLPARMTGGRRAHKKLRKRAVERAEARLHAREEVTGA